jgi:hypothetical protein
LLSAAKDSPSAEERGDQADVVVSTILGKTGRALGQALADVATIGICPERSIRRGEVLSERLQTALTHRAIIEQAKEVLAHQGDLSMHAVFDRLRSHARNRSKRLSEVARQVVEGDLGEDLLTAPQPTAPRPSNGNPDLDVLCAGPGDRRGANPVKTRRPRATTTKGGWN